MLLADVTFSTEGMVVITALVAALAGAVGLLYRELLKSKNDTIASLEKNFELQMVKEDTENKTQLADQKNQYESRLKDLKSEKESYKEIGYEAVKALEKKVNALLALKGDPPFKPMAAVVPEHSSPVTEKQQHAADLQTLRARITAAVLAAGLEPREPGEPESPFATKKREEIEEQVAKETHAHETDDSKGHVALKEGFSNVSDKLDKAIDNSKTGEQHIVIEEFGEKAVEQLKASREKAEQAAQEEIQRHKKDAYGDAPPG